MVTWPKASSTPSLAIMRLARASSVRAWSSLFGTGVFPYCVFWGFLSRFVAWLPVLGRQLEAVEGKAGRDRAADQGPVAEGFRRLPGARRHRELRHLVAVDVGAEPDDFFFRAVHHFELERRAGVIVPDLGGVDTMPVRALAARQQEIDRGGGGAAVDDARIADEDRKAQNRMQRHSWYSDMGDDATKYLSSPDRQIINRFCSFLHSRD